MKETPWHPAANIFPLDEEHIDELAEDIKEHGLQIPIEMFEGKIIDGRRRWMACERADVEPDILDIDTDDPVAYVLSLNLHRRQLTTSQIGIVAGRAKTLRENMEREAKKRMLAGKAPDPPQNSAEGGDTRKNLGKALGVSHDTVDKGVRVVNSDNPDLVAAVQSGKLSLNKADGIARLPQGEQTAALKEAVEPGRQGKKKSQQKPPSDEWKSKTINRTTLEKIAKQIEALQEMMDKPTLTISIASVKKNVRELREMVSRILG